MEQPKNCTPVAILPAGRALRGVTGMMLAAGFLTAGAGCTSSPQRPKTSSFATPAAKGEAVDRPFVFAPPIELTSREGAKDDGIVRILSNVTCTGTLIAEDLVLTAHHCVAERDENRRPTGKDVDPESLIVELGGDYLSWGEVKVKAIVSPDCGYLKGHGDIAILVLKRKLIGVATLTPRLDSPARGPSGIRPGEFIIPVGFGRCALSRDAIKRERRTGGLIESVGTTDFTLQASICPGDSGGPAIVRETDEVVGVISSSMMDGDDETLAPSFFTRLDIWSQLFSAAQEIANGASPSELPPFRSCAP
ncbi:MAG: S1 family peptidase [Polyangiaceae bacterium]|nr:S1 family peptidase [Polyangiaceae bacterium]